MGLPSAMVTQRNTVVALGIILFKFSVLFWLPICQVICVSSCMGYLRKQGGEGSRVGESQHNEGGHSGRYLGSCVAHKKMKSGAGVSAATSAGAGAGAAIGAGAGGGAGDVAASAGAGAGVGAGAVVGTAMMGRGADDEDASPLPRSRFSALPNFT